MTDAQAALAQVREALKAGPTRGNWVVAPKMTMPSIVCAVNNVEVCPADHRDPSHQDVDAAYIAAANPANIAAILAHEREQEAEIERLRRERDEARAERDDLRGALHTCLWAMRQPLDGWKGDCERKAMDKANAALAQIEQERSK